MSDNANEEVNPVTWIKTISINDADEKLKKAMEAQRKLYPAEYAVPIHPTPDGTASQIVASHSLIPEALFHAFATRRDRNRLVGVSVDGDHSACPEQLNHAVKRKTTPRTEPDNSSSLLLTALRTKHGDCSSSTD